MEFLKINRKKSGKKNKSGVLPANIYWVSKPNKKCDEKYVKTQAISILKNIFVSGGHDSGKSRFLNRLYEVERRVWGNKSRSAALYFSGITPLGAWLDNDDVEIWFNKAKPNSKTSWKRLQQWDKTHLLSEYLVDTGAILFIDDAHKLSGRKLQVAKACLTACRIFVVSSSEEQRLAPSIRGTILRRKPQIFRLGTDQSYDVTNLLMWGMILGFTLIGFWEVSLVLGGLKALGSGKRAARSD